MSSLTSRDLETLRPDFDKVVEKVLGITHNDVLSTIEKCLTHGYDRKKSVEKLGDIIDLKKANRIFEKLDDLLEQYKTMSSKAKKRSHDDDHNETDIMNKKPKSSPFDKRPNISVPSITQIVPTAVSGNTTPMGMITGQPTAGTLTPQQISAMMANAQREIEERKKALSANAQTKPETPSVNPEESDRAKKIAFLQAQIKAKLSGISLTTIVPPIQEKPKPLILDEQGRTVDNAGRAINIPTLAPTLKANIRAKKKETFNKTTTHQERIVIEEGTKFVDDRINIKPAIRNKRALRFHEPGKFQQMAEKIRMKAKLEKLQNEISQIARKTGVSSATKLALIAPKQDSHSDDVPSMEWWDSVILSCDLNTMDGDKIAIRESAITNLIEHPTQMKPPSKYPSNFNKIHHFFLTLLIRIYSFCFETR